MSNSDYAKTGRKGIGKADLVRYRKGEKLTQREAILAKCYECMGGYADGRRDCRIKDCPLYPFMPYVGQEEVIDPENNA
jgi:hypothetical protein